MYVVWVTCPTKNCGYSPFPMESGHHTRVQRTGEDFFCPSRHSLVYNDGLTADQVEIERLKKRLNYSQRDLESWRERALTAERTCPWAACGFVAQDPRGLGTHMRAIHGMPTLAVAREAS